MVKAGLRSTLGGDRWDSGGKYGKMKAFTSVLALIFR